MKKALIILGVLLLTGPILSLVALSLLLITPASQASACVSGNITVVADVPDTLTAETQSGTSLVLNRSQLTHARTIIMTGAAIPQVEKNGIIIALMAALTESTLRMLSNTSAHPSSATFPHDGNGEDHDSLGLFQMRPQSGWGTVAQLMDPEYQAQAFFGGPTGPNHGSPRGLLDIPGWSALTPGQAAQKVEVSAFPDRYNNYEPVAHSIFDALTSPGDTTPGDATPARMASSSTVYVPIEKGAYNISSPYGMRNNPLRPGTQEMHWGTDFAAPDGTPILAMADGKVLWAGHKQGWNNVLAIEHNINGERITTVYVHMWDHGFAVATGDTVRAGQHIADVGSEGFSTGPHLHFEIHPGGWETPAVDAEVWLNTHSAIHLDGDPLKGATTCAT